MKKAIATLFLIIAMGLWGCSKKPLETINGNWALSLDSVPKELANQEEEALFGRAARTDGRIQGVC